MENNDIPEKNDVVLESVFSFDERIFAALSVDEKENALLVMKQILDDLTFQLQLLKHSKIK